MSNRISSEFQPIGRGFEMSLNIFPSHSTWRVWSSLHDSPKMELLAPPPAFQFSAAEQRITKPPRARSEDDVVSCAQLRGLPSQCPRGPAGRGNVENTMIPFCSFDTFCNWGHLSTFIFLCFTSRSILNRKCSLFRFIFVDITYNINYIKPLLGIEIFLRGTNG